MKKLLIFLLVVLIATAGFVYGIIPGKMSVRKSLVIAANKDGLYRKLGDAGAWKEWWPGQIDSQSNEYTLNDIRFSPDAPMILSIPFRIENKNQKTRADLTLVAQGTDFSILHLEAAFLLPVNPIQRVRDYFAVKRIKESCSQLLDAINTQYSQVANLYNYAIRKELVVDSNLIFIATELKGYPGNSLIYSMAAKLKNYIAEQKAAETGFPMLNVFTRDSLNYQLRVAIPVDRRLPDAGDIRYKWMLGGGNILITEVKGGPEEIKKAYQQIINYVNDHKRIAPAIPFESLVTDRLQEKDSSKWITRIYYPVM